VLNYNVDNASSQGNRMGFLRNWLWGVVVPRAVTHVVAPRLRDMNSKPSSNECSNSRSDEGSKLSFDESSKPSLEKGSVPSFEKGSKPSSLPSWHEQLTPAELEALQYYNEECQ
jgi:hypothetical protein